MTAFYADASMVRAISNARARRFIGRIAELDAFDLARRELAKGHGSIILVDGEAGIGKSRTVAHALRAVSGGRASRLVTVECVQEAAAELTPIRVFLASIPSVDLIGAPPLALRAIAQLIPDMAGSELVQRFAGATLGKTELFAGLVAALTIASAKRGTILALEDIHWADRTSLEFLAALASHIETMRLLVIATCRGDSFERDDSLADIISRLLRGSGVRHLQLQPLRRSDVQELIADALPDRSAIAAPTLAAIVERCEGNPFFAEELLKAALEQNGGRRSLPLSIRAGIRHRLAVLEAGHREMLEVAAVLGLRFDLALLARLTAGTDTQVLDMLRAALAAGIVDEDGAAFRFHHALTREAIYDSLLAAQTQVLHRRILDVLRAGSDEGGTIEALAYHAWQAGDAAATLLYSERAGDRALERGMFYDARTYYERIVDAADDQLRARLHERLGTIAAAQGDFHAAITELETALALRIGRADYDDAARIAVALAAEQSNFGRDPVRPLESFLERFETRLSDRVRDNAIVFLARVMTAVGNFDRAHELLNRIAAIESLEPRVRANAITCRLNLSEHRGLAETWRAAAGDMLTLAPALPPLMRAVALTTVAQTGTWLGEARIANAALDDSRKIALQWGFEGLFVFTCAVDATLAFLAGDLIVARRALDAVASRPDVAPAAILAARIGPFVAAALNDTNLGARYIGMEETTHNDEADRLFFNAGMLVAGTRSAAPTFRVRLAQQLSQRTASALLPSVVAVAGAQHLDATDLPALLRITDTPSKGENGASNATRDLVAAIVARRLGTADDLAASRAAVGFERIAWPRFAELARTLTSAGSDHGDPPLLTARETQVARLIAEGAANAVIAGRLDIGVKTVEKIVANILSKLGARSRARIAAYIAEMRD